jgi:hypothetical protein
VYFESFLVLKNICDSLFTLDAAWLGDFNKLSYIYRALLQ